MMKKGASFFPGEGGGGGGKSSGLKCKVVLLDGREVQLDINKKTPGQWVFDHVSRKLGVLERDYFGLLYEDVQKCQQWLEMAKPIKKQTKKSQNQLFFCVRYYPIDSMTISETTKIQLYWQLKRDFTSGRLPCPPDSMLQLVAFMAQVELDDWTGQYLDYDTSLGLQKKELISRESEISLRHQQLRGTSQVDARSEFLKIVNGLELYGMVFFDVRYEDKVPYILGLSPTGLALCKRMKIVQSYKWFRVVQVLYRGRRFIVRVSGDWIANNKIQQLSFDVDSSKTCKDLYNTFVEHINFYAKHSVKPKEEDADHKGGTTTPTKTFTRLPTSSSIEEISRQLNGNGSDRKAREDRLHRSLSLPRKSNNRINVQHVKTLFPPSHPQMTNTTISDPVLKALQARMMKNRSQSASPPCDGDQPGTTYSSSEQSGESEVNSNSDPSPEAGLSDTQSIDSRNSMHDSLLGLADDLGNETEKEQRKEVFVIQELDSSPGQKKHRSNSLPQIAIFDPSSQPTSPPGESKEGKKVQSASEEKLQNRMLLRHWVREQKKKDIANTSSSSSMPQWDQTDGLLQTPPLSQSTLPLKLSSSNGSSPMRPYKLKGGYSPSSIERPSSSLLPQPNSNLFDLYDVPRPSPAPSPSLHCKPHPFSVFSVSSHSSLHSVSNIGRSTGTIDSQNDYDIPRSLIDNPFLTTRSVTGQTSYSINSRKSSSSSDPVSQLAMLKDEYPDYDFPKPSNNDPDYDIPKPYNNFKSVCTTADSRSEDNLSFGPLDKMMADIDNEARQLQLHTQEEDKPPKVEREEGEQQASGSSMSEEEEDVTDKKRSSHQLQRQEEANQLVSPPSVATISTGNLAEPALSRRVIQPLTHQAASSPQLGSNSTGDESTYDRLSARIALQRLKEDGIVPQDVVEKKGHEEERENKIVKGYSYDAAAKIQPHLTDLTNQMKLEDLLQSNATNQSKLVQGMPFDPDFFARQTALEQGRTNKQQQQQQHRGQQHLPPDHPKEEVRQGKEELATVENSSKPPSSAAEPIYQEIPDLRAAITHRSQSSWSGSRGNLSSTTAISQIGNSKQHKRTYSGGDLLSVKTPQRHPMKTQSISTEEVTATSLLSKQEKNDFDHKRCHSFGARRPLQTTLTNDEESVPNSPSFYTKHPEAGTMSCSQPVGEHDFFPNHLSNLDSGTTGRHNRVMNWMKQNAFSDHTHQAVPQGSPVLVARSMSMSQSVHSQLGRSGLQKRGTTVTLPNRFKGHLYEVSSLHKQGGGVAAMTMSQTKLNYPRSKFMASAVPYVTRELPCPKSGATMYATDV